VAVAGRVRNRVGGSHGDLAQALALAVWEQGRGGSFSARGAEADGDGLAVTGGVGASADRLAYDMHL
jgi:hypothetical protein